MLESVEKHRVKLARERIHVGVGKDALEIDSIFEHSESYRMN